MKSDKPTGDFGEGQWNILQEGRKFPHIHIVVGPGMGKVRTIAELMTKMKTEALLDVARATLNASSKILDEAHLSTTHQDSTQQEETQQDETPCDPVTPPALPEFVLMLLASDGQREGAVGDLNERFQQDREAFGQQRAARIYWARAMRSLWPLLLRAASRAAKWATIVSALKRLF